MNIELEALKWVERKYVGAMEMDGICAALQKWRLETLTVERRNAVAAIERKMFEWPEFSGEEIYPVPGFDDEGDAVDACEAFAETATSDKWNEDHPYGAARIRLLRWLISEFEKETEDDN